MSETMSIAKRPFLSIRKHITKGDFIHFTGRFQQTLGELWGPLTTEIRLYGKIPVGSKDVISEDDADSLKKYNEEGMQVLRGLDDLPEEFSSIPFLAVRIVPDGTTPGYVLGDVTFGAMLPSHILFYAHAHGRPLKPIKELLFSVNQIPAGINLGDGREKNAFACNWVV